MNLLHGMCFGTPLVAYFPSLHATLHFVYRIRSRCPA